MSYAEALIMARSAIKAIDDIEKGKMTNWIKFTANNRKAKVLLGLFRIKTAKPFYSMSAEDAANLDKIRQVYLIMISKANENQLLYRLYCGDDYIIHFNPTDDDPWYPGEGRKVAKEPKLAEYGGWYDGSNWLPSKKMNEQRSELFCGEDTNAFTLPQFRSITWCPLAFLGYYGDSHGLKPSTTFIKQKQNRIKSHEQLSNYYSLASVWIHEWTHLQSGTRDQPAYDADSNIIVNEDSYGYYYCANLARKIANPANPGDDPNGPDTQSGKSLAIANADNYAYFALAMYLNEWDWGEGIALNRFGF